LKPLSQDVVAVRGGGDIATGVIQKLFRAGLKVVILERRRPTAIRRTVALSEAAYDGWAKVEDLTARLTAEAAGCLPVWARDEIPLLIDPDGGSLKSLAPDGVVDATLAKINQGLHPGLAKIVIACGPGFTAPVDAHAVIETWRGPELGRVIFQGRARQDTGQPAEIKGRSLERVLRAPQGGPIRHHRQIGEMVEAGEPVFSVGDLLVRAPFTGLLRGLIREGLEVTPGLKTADLDPRLDVDCRAISDKARAIGGGVLETYLFLRKNRDEP